MIRGGLTKPQAQVLKFIADFISENDYSPKYEEIRAGANLASKSQVFWLVAELEHRGHLVRIPGRHRSLAVVTKGDQEATDLLPKKVRGELLAFCKRTGERPEDVIADAVALYVDEEEAKAITEVRAPR